MVAIICIVVFNAGINRLLIQNVSHGTKQKVSKIMEHIWEKIAILKKH